MAITAALKYSVNGVFVGQTGPTSHTTSAFTPSNNSLLVLTLNCISSSADRVTFTVGSSPSLTWTKRPQGLSGFGSAAAQSEIWTAEVATGASTTVTIGATADNVFSGDGTATAFSITEYTGYDSVSPFGVTGAGGAGSSHSSSPYSLSLSGTSASDSAVHATSALDGDHGDPLVGVGSGWTSLYNTQCATSGWFRSCTEYLIGATATADFTSFLTAYQYAAAALEIKAAGGGAAPFLPDNRPQRAAPIMAQ